MRKISLCAVAAALMATGFGVWAVSTTNAHVAPSTGQGIEPFRLMTNAKDCLRCSLSTIPSCSITANKRNLFCHRGVANPSMDCARRQKWRQVFSFTGHT